MSYDLGLILIAQLPVVTSVLVRTLFFFEIALMLVGKSRKDYAVERKYINFKTLWLRYSCSLSYELPMRLVSLKALQMVRKLGK